jgi:hypothetical protein
LPRIAATQPTPILYPDRQTVRQGGGFFVIACRRCDFTEPLLLFPNYKATNRSVKRHSRIIFIYLLLSNIYTSSPFADSFSQSANI